MMRNFKAGNYVNQGYYRSYEPNPINRDWKVDDMQVLNLLSKADRQLGRLDMYSEYVSIEHYIRMHIAKEAVESSKIEGTQTNMEEAFLRKEDIRVEKRDDWEEVQNYITAMNEAVGKLHQLPFSSRLIKQSHETLLQGVRGEHKMPGEYRRSQNWIGGVNLNDAVFVPPVHSSINGLMSDLEKFANDDQNELPDLLKIALIHYQFETIHPFLDGNGRVGRLLITLYLVSKGILKQPILYLSAYFEKHRTLYYENLMIVRTNNDLSQWFKFFLNGIIDTARNGVETFDGIMQLQKELERKIQEIGTRSGDVFKVVEQLYRHPIIDARRTGEIIGKSLRTAYKLLSVMEDIGIIKDISQARRGKYYIFKDYMDIFAREL